MLTNMRPEDLEREGAHTSLNIRNALVGLQEVRDNLVKAANDSPSPRLKDAVHTIQKLIGDYRSTLFDLKVTSFSPLFYHKWIDGWIQSRADDVKAVLGVSLTNQGPEPTSGTVYASIVDYNPGINGPESHTFTLASTTNQITQLASGETQNVYFSSEGVPPGLYYLHVQYNIHDHVNEQWVLNPDTQVFERSGGFYTAAESFQPYMVPSTRESVSHTINALLGITVTYGPEGCLTAQGTSRDGLRRYLRKTLGISAGYYYSELTYTEIGKDGSPGLAYRVRTQLSTYSEKFNGRTLSPNYTVTAESGRLALASNGSVSFDWNYYGSPKQRLALKVTPGREGLFDEMYIDGLHFRDLVSGPGESPRWGRTWPIYGYITGTTYQPNPGIDKADFDIQTLFPEELGHLSYFASVLNEFDDIEDGPPSFDPEGGELGRVDQALGRIPYDKWHLDHKFQYPPGVTGPVYPPKWIAIALVAAFTIPLTGEILGAAAVAAAVAAARAIAALTGEILTAEKIAQITAGAVAGNKAKLAYTWAVGAISTTAAMLLSAVKGPETQFGPPLPAVQQRTPSLPPMPDMPSMPDPWPPDVAADCGMSCPSGQVCMFGECIDISDPGVDNP
jgi:hypothetical protein